MQSGVLVLDKPEGPSSAQVVNLTATLTGGEETTATPGVLGLVTGAVGTASVSVDAASEEIAVTLSLFNFSTGPLAHTSSRL